MISFGSSDLPRAPAILYDPRMFDKSQCETTTTTTTTTTISMIDVYLQWDPKGAPASVGLRKQLS